MGQIAAATGNLPGPKTGQMVEFLFLHTMNRVGGCYIKQNGDSAVLYLVNFRSSPSQLKSTFANGRIQFSSQEKLKRSRLLPLCLVLLGFVVISSVLTSQIFCLSPGLR